MMRKSLNIILLSVLLQGCATTDEDLAKLEKELTAVPVAVAPPAPTAEPEAEAPEEEPLARYSEMNNMAPPSDRQYKRMTRKKMEEESELYSSAGSLWKMEGQTSYLFAENKHRREGDPTTIKMEGAALKLIENKVAVVQDLLKQLENQKLKAEEDSVKAEAEKMRLAQIEEEKNLRAQKIARGEIVIDPMEEQMKELSAPSAKAAVDTRKPAGTIAEKAEKEEKIDLKDIENIPSRIVEKMSGDTYRIRGQQYLTIKRKPYKVIATALIRAEDFKDGGVSSSKLLEAQYDLIHIKRTAE